MIGIGEKVVGILSEPLKADGIKTLQLNLGYKCNAACKHCHITAGPERTETMGRPIIEEALRVSRDNPIKTLDITGGAPELHPSFRYLVESARRLGLHVIVRTNLTVFFEEGMGDLPGFYADQDVEIIASLPHYTEASTDRVRGTGTFPRSIEALKRLHNLDYGASEQRKLNLVYNPLGAFLPACQSDLEEQYKRELFSAFGIIFNRLYTLANMPLGRFRDFLIRSNNLDLYMEKVRNAFNPDTLNHLMCRSLISVGWDGRLYDCDFNQALGLTVDRNCPSHIRDFHYSLLSERNIVMGDHCYVCAAGSGSS